MRMNEDHIDVGASDLSAFRRGELGLKPVATL